jgi:TPR repeat protein
MVIAMKRERERNATIWFMLGQKTPSARPRTTGRWHLPRAWWVTGLGLGGLLIVAAAALEVWENPPSWLYFSRVLVVTGLHWARVHWLTSGAAGVVVTLLIYGLQRRAERHRIEADGHQRAIAVQAAEGQRQAAAEAALAVLLAKHCWVDEATGWLPRVRQVSDPVALGVHPAVDPPTIAGTPAPERPRNAPLYVPRDLDSALDQAVARGGLVLLVGDSTAGKSRAAFEAIHRHLGDRWLLVPSRRDSLRTLLDAEIQFRDTVVWLNDLERYVGPDGLDEGLLRRLLGDGTRRIVVLATMRATEYATRSPVHDLGQPDHKRIQRRAEQMLLDQVTQRLQVARLFSDSEQQHARIRSQDDPRIADALKHADRYGLAEYLAAGPKLLQEWDDAWAIGNQPAGAALVAAAVDSRRAGLDEPVPADVLLKLAPSYLDTTIAGLLSPNAFQRGLEWAAAPRYGASALLVRHVDGGYLAFDYLFDNLERNPNAPEIPEAIWQSVVAAAKEDTAKSVALRADYARPRRPDVAERAYRKAADAGDVDAMVAVGSLANARDDPNEAIAWYRKAANAGDIEAMRRLGSMVEPDEAIAWYRKAANAGDIEAMRRLGRRASDRGERIAWLRKAADAGDIAAMNWLGMEFEYSRHWDEATVWYLQAADAGHAWAMRRLGLLAAQGGTSSLSALRSAADAGALWAMNELRLAAEGGSTSVLAALRTAADADALWAMEMLGWLARRQGDQQEAEAWFRRASDAGDLVAIRELGRLAEEGGHPEQAVAWYCKMTGDFEATEGLSRLAEAGSISALDALHAAAASDDPEATEALRRLSPHSARPHHSPEGG